MVTVTEETCTRLGGLEFGDEVVVEDGDGVPEMRGEGGEEGFVDTAAES